MTANNPAHDPRGSLFGFWALIVAQFQGAFSDNTLKWLVSFLVLELGVSHERRDFLFVLVIPLVFAVPFLMFSIPGGYVADRFSKRSVTVWTKALEVVTMCFVTFALWQNRLDLAAVALFLVCTQGAIFGPSKYGLLPELLPTSKLSWGNGVIELWTLLAAIGGTLSGGFLAHFFRGRQEWSGVFLIILSLFGLLSSLGISRVPVADAQRKFAWNWVKEFFEEVGRMREGRGVVGGHHRQHLFLVPGCNPTVEHRSVRDRYLAGGRSAQQLPAGRTESGHWCGELHGWLGVGSQDRDRYDLAGLSRHCADDWLRCLSRALPTKS